MKARSVPKYYWTVVQDYYDAATVVQELADSWCGLNSLDSSRSDAERMAVEAVEKLRQAASGLRCAAAAEIKAREAKEN